MIKFVVARQIYKTDASQEYVIVGNDAMIKCQYPSFVSDFLEVQGWEDSEGGVYSTDPGAKINLGNFHRPWHGLLVFLLLLRGKSKSKIAFTFFSSWFWCFYQIFSCTPRIPRSGSWRISHYWQWCSIQMQYSELCNRLCVCEQLDWLRRSFLHRKSKFW